MKLKIYFENLSSEKISYKLKMLVRKSILATLDYEDVESNCEVSVTFTDNEGIRALNAEYRNIDKATDVLSFPLINYDEGEELEDEVMLGDIVLSLERAREQAEEFGHSFERECAFLCAHSTLHLLGYDHEISDEDDADMRRRQSEIMKKLGLEIK